MLAGPVHFSPNRTPPHRRLRNPPGGVSPCRQSTPPHRRLRKDYEVAHGLGKGTPPHRRLRNVVFLGNGDQVGTPPHRRLRNITEHSLIVRWKCQPKIDPLRQPNFDPPLVK